MRPPGTECGLSVVRSQLRDRDCATHEHEVDFDTGERDKPTGYLLGRAMYCRCGHLGRSVASPQ